MGLFFSFIGLAATGAIPILSRYSSSQEAIGALSLLEEAMGNFFRYLFIMPTLARFELDVHERVERGEGLSADDMIRIDG